MRKPCCEKTETTKGAWSKQEDQKLIDYIKKHGQGCWNSLPKAAGLRRCGKSCRLRWINYLRPGLKRGSFGEDEEDLIIRLHALLGNRWSLIAGRLPGRTDNEVKNYWNSHIRKKLLKMGTGTITTTTTTHHVVHHHHPNINYKPLTAINKVVNLGHDTNKDDQEVSDSMATSSGTAAISSCLPDLNLELTL